MIENWLPTYDIIYQTVINNSIPIEANKGRDLSVDYRNDIGLEMVNACEKFNLAPISLTSENVDTELELVIERITKAFSLKT